MNDKQKSWLTDDEFLNDKSPMEIGAEICSAIDNVSTVLMRLEDRQDELLAAHKRLEIIAQKNSDELVEKLSRLRTHNQ